MHTIDPLNALAVHTASASSDILRSISRYFTSSFLIPSQKLKLCSAMQRSNLYMRMERVMAFDTGSELVELGSREGESTRMIAGEMKLYQRVGSEFDHMLY